MRATVDKDFFFVGKVLGGPLDDGKFGHTNLVHLATTGVVVVHQERQVRRGNNKPLLRAPEVSRH